MDKQHCKECVRVLQMVGDDRKKNDVIFCGERKPAAMNVIFFPGDVQDYKENMLAHKDNWQYVDWDIESTAATLCRRFPASHVWVVKASQMIHGTFSTYANFVRWKEHKSGALGPSHTSGQRSWHHLRCLLDSAVNRMNVISSSGVASQSDGVFNVRIPTVIVGFSKGCVVLNQLTYDLAVKPDVQEVEDFIQSVTTMYWLDGGHGGGSNVWITDDDLLRSLSRFEIHSDVTPYQIHDPSRPWIGQEHEMFITILHRHKTRVKSALHFADQKRSLENHFGILRSF